MATYVGALKGDEITSNELIDDYWSRTCSHDFPQLESTVNGRGCQWSEASGSAQSRLVEVRLSVLAGLLEEARPESAWEYTSFGGYVDLESHLVAVAEWLDETGLDRARAAGWLHDVGSACNNEPTTRRHWTPCNEHSPSSRPPTGQPPRASPSPSATSGTPHLLGDYLASLDTLQRALAINEAAYPANHPNIATTLGNIGITQQSLGDYQASLDHPATSTRHQRGLLPSQPPQHRHHPHQHREHPTTVGGLPGVTRHPATSTRHQRGRLPGQPPRNRRHPHQHRAHPTTFGDYQASLATLQRALAINEAAYPANHPEIAVTLTNIGLTQQRSGDYQASLATLQRALAIFEAAYPANHPNIAVTLGNIGITQQLLGDYQASLATLQRALAIKEAAYPANHPEIAVTLTNIGLTQQLLGDYQASLATLQRALAIKEAAYPANHPEIATTLGNTANVLENLNRLDEATDVMRRARDIFRGGTRPGSPLHQPAGSPLGRGSSNSSGCSVTRRLLSRHHLNQEGPLWPI